MNPGPYPPQGNNPQPPYYPPPPYGNSPPPVQPPPHRYSGWLLAALVTGYIVAIVLEFIEIAVTSTPNASGGTAGPGILGSIGGPLLIILNVVIIIADSQSFFTLYGKLRWRQMKTWMKIVLFFIYFGLCVMPAIYLVMATRYYLRGRQQRLRDALRDGWLWYRSKTQKAQITLGVVAACLLVFGVIGVSAAAMADRAATLALLTPTAAPTQATLTANAPTSTATLVPTATPTPKPTPALTKPTPTPTPKPKPKPTPKPSCNAVNGNPWCYNFDSNGGSLITNPPSNFCDYFNCIASFWAPDDPDGGYVVQCVDGTFSQSGGESGSCSHHGGNSRPLYSH